jgi:hypothetical protein
MNGNESTHSETYKGHRNQCSKGVIAVYLKTAQIINLIPYLKALGKKQTKANRRKGIKRSD